MPSRIRVEHVGETDRERLRGLLHDAGKDPQCWSNEPSESWGWHSHDRAKVVYCLEGAVTFHTEDGDLHVRPGDRLEIPARARHAATVGVAGVSCMEVYL
jgi:mannose-6-phosphate isomerase-like protein (cupin superfamily)